MTKTRYLPIVPLTLISLANLPFALAPEDLSRPLAILVSLVGLAGLVAAVALARQASWATPAVAGLGLVNLVGALVALSADRDGAIVGVVLGAATVILAAPLLIGSSRNPGLAGGS